MTYVYNPDEDDPDLLDEERREYEAQEAEHEARQVAARAAEAAGPPWWLPPGSRLCENPNSCPNASQRRGTRCPACYKYRLRHRGKERPLRWLSRAHSWLGTYQGS